MPKSNWNVGKDKTVWLQPILPFGGADDAVYMETSEGRRVCWQIGENLFLRVNIWNKASDIVYLILDREKMQDDCLEFLRQEAVPCASMPVTLGAKGMDGLKEFRFLRVIKAINETDLRA